MNRWLSLRACFDVLRRRFRPKRPHVDPHIFTVAELDEALGKVPRFERHIFVLHRVDEMTYPQIAAFLGISERRVERAIARALTCTRRALSDIARRR